MITRMGTAGGPFLQPGFKPLKHSGQPAVGVQVHHERQPLFTGYSNLLKTYGIDPKAVSVAIRSPHLTESQQKEIQHNKPVLLNRLAQAHEHALKSRRLGTSKFSNRQYATNMELELDLGQGKKKRFWVTAGNFEMNISELICSERGGMATALNKAVNQLPKSLIDQLPENTNIDSMLKVTRMIITTSKPIGEDPSWFPCSDCCAWMGTNRFFSPETQLFGITKEPDNTFNIEARTLKDVLPRQGLQQVSFSDKALETLPIEVSETAKAVLANTPLPEADIRGLLATAKTGFEQNHVLNPGFSGKEDTAAVRFLNSGQLFTGHRTEWVPRWPMHGDQLAVAKGIEALTRQGIKEPIIQAVAYYGDHPELPSIASVGRMAQRRGSKDVLLIALENDRIQVRTIRDYQPHVHGSTRQLSANRSSV